MSYAHDISLYIKTTDNLLRLDEDASSSYALLDAFDPYQCHHPDEQSFPGTKATAGLVDSLRVRLGLCEARIDQRFSCDGSAL